MALDREHRVSGGAAADHVAKVESHDPQHAARLQRVIARARAYHARHADWVHEFNTLTHGKCAEGAEGVSYRALRNWQAEHGLPVDGLLGPETLAKARHLGEQKHGHHEEAHHEAPKPEEPKQQPKPPEHHDPEAKHIAEEAESHAQVHHKAEPPPAAHEPAPEPKPPAPQPAAAPAPAASPTGAVAGESHAVHPTAGVRETTTAEVESSREAKGSKEHLFAHSQDGYRKVYQVGKAQVMVFLPAQGIVPPSVDVFMFFHGMYADFATDKADNFQDENPAKGADMAHAVTASARNVIAILPMQWPGFDGSYKKVVDQVLVNVGNDMGVAAPLKLGNVSVAGHSLGGAALGRGVKDMMDDVTDVTLQDAGYGGDAFQQSFLQVRDWMLLGKGPKTLRLITQDVKGRGERNTEKNKHGLNEASFTSRIAELQQAKKLNKALTVTHQAFGDPPKEFQGAFLELRVDVAGPDGKQGSMYVFREHGTHQNGLKHFDIRDQSMLENIAAGKEAGFGVHDGVSHEAPQEKKPVESGPKPTAPQQQVTPVAPPKHEAPKHDEKPHGAEHHAHKPTPAPDKQVPVTTKPKDAVEKAPAEKKPEQPIAAVALDAGDLQKSVDELHDPKVSAVAKDLAALVAQSQELLKPDPKKKEEDLQHEVRSDGRLDLVKRIGEVHAEIEALQGGVDAKKLAAVKGRMFRMLQELSPYHSQFRNVDILEADGPDAKHRVKGSTTVRTRTCNLTSLAMALEGIGKGVHTYNGNPDKIAKVAKEFRPELKKAELAVGGAHDGNFVDYAALQALRLPDFLELAAVAHYWNGKGGSEEILAAGAVAWPEIMSQSFLETLAGEFGAKAEIKWFRFDPSTAKHDKKGNEIASKESSTLASSASHTQRGNVDKLIDLRNKAEAAKGKPGEKDARQAYEKAEAQLHNALEGAGIEKNIPLEAYKKAITDQIGGELDSGASVQTVVTAHYVRVHAIEADYVVIDDPGQQTRAHKKVLWEEARAQGMFARRMVLR